MNKVYTENQKQWIILNGLNGKDEEILQQFNAMAGTSISLDAFRKLRYRLGVKKPRGRIKTTKYRN